MLVDRIRNKESGILFYGITPPKSNNTKERVAEISKKHMDRINQLDIDGLIIYDIQDETVRTKMARPFEFIRTVDPSYYGNYYLKDLKVPKVVYRCVGNYEEDAFVDWLEEGIDDITVFVGVGSKQQKVIISLDKAYELRNKYNPNMLLGAVTIPERHMETGNEDERVGFKMKQGCSFFVSQAVYDIEASKEFLYAYKKYCIKKQVDMVPIIFTLTPCGSKKTLTFIKWLGISVPKWLEDGLLASEEMLDKSIEVITDIYKELTEIGKKEGIPVGCNVESVSIRKEEIDGSIRLAKNIGIYIKEQKNN